MWCEMCQMKVTHTCLKEKVKMCQFSAFVNSTTKTPTMETYPYQYQNRIPNLAHSLLNPAHWFQISHSAKTYLKQTHVQCYAIPFLFRFVSFRESLFIRCLWAISEIRINTFIYTNTRRSNPMDWLFSFEIDVARDMISLL